MRRMMQVIVYIFSHARKEAAMDNRIFTLDNITAMVKPLAEKYHVKEIYLFGSYARGEADENSDLGKH